MKKRLNELRPVFVEHIPDLLDPGLLYVSMKYATCAHSCACGCGGKVFTPLSPDDWQLYYDGHTITLTPSIGNFRFACCSHYFVRNNRIIWVNDSNWHWKEKNDIRKKKAKLPLWKRLFVNYIVK